MTGLSVVCLYAWDSHGVLNDVLVSNNFTVGCIGVPYYFLNPDQRIVNMACERNGEIQADSNREREEQRRAQTSETPKTPPGKPETKRPKTLN